jgi:hypothetical protein
LVILKLTQGFIVNATIVDIIEATIAYFGIGHIYSHIIHQTANIDQKASNLVTVERITHNSTSLIAIKIASNLVFQELYLSFKCLFIFSTTTVESSTSIHKTKIKAKSVILFILSQTNNANTNTNHKVKGIEIAVLKAFFTHKYKAKTINTIIIDSTKLIRSIFVASFAFFHSLEIISTFISFGNVFIISCNVLLISLVTFTTLVHNFFQIHKKTV